VLVDLQTVSPEGHVIDCTVPPSSVATDSREFRLDDGAMLKGRLEASKGRAYRLKGSLSARARVTCVRCLEIFDFPVCEVLDLSYLPQSDNVALDEQQDRSLDEEEMAVSFYRDDAIDLGHLVWEQIVLSLPMKPVCRPECQGLCPECGTNRNRETCSCVLDDLDPRWQSLKALSESEPSQD